MALTAEQQEFLTGAYQDLHIGQGRTGEAAVLVYRTMIENGETQGFTDYKNAEWAGELALMVSTLSLAAAKKSESLDDGVIHLQRAIVTALNRFPIGSGQDAVANALERDKYWDPVFGTEYNAQLRCARDLMTILDFTAILGNAPELALLSQSILKTLTINLNEFSDKSAIHILRIERGNLWEARRAFFNFLKEKGLVSIRQNKTELVNVAAKFLKNSSEHGGVEAKVLKFLASKNEKLQSLWSKVIASTSYRESLESFKEKKQLSSTSSPSVADVLVERLNSISHIGLGIRRAERIERD